MEVFGSYRSGPCGDLWPCDSDVMSDIMLHRSIGVTWLCDSWELRHDGLVLCLESQLEGGMMRWVVQHNVLDS